jgi:RHS repeat-associated protein
MPNTYTWTTTAADVGTNAVRVSVRNGGSLADFEDTATLLVEVVEGEEGGLWLRIPERLAWWKRWYDPRVPVALGISYESIATNSEGSARRHSLYTPELQLLAETEITTSATPAVAYEYIWFAGQPLAQIATATGAIQWYFNDHLGTPILQTDGDAGVVWRVEYDPYGTVFSYRTGPDQRQPLRFPGQESAADDLSYNIFRWYRSGWGRYTQGDPRFEYDSRDAHEYAYVDLNPTRWIDPVGLFTIDKSCNDFDCTPAFDPQLTTLGQLREETEALCLSLDPLITNVALRKCIKRSCDKGSIKCTDPMGDCAKNPTWGAYALVGSLKKPNRTVFVCISNWGQGPKVPGQVGDLVIHEWAHGCGWVHGGGQGVPRDPGAAGGGH